MKHVVIGLALWLAGSSLAWAGTRTIIVTGTIDETAAVTVNGTPATVSGSGFSASITLSEGPNNTITATATDPAGNSATASVTVALDTVPPVIVISFPTNGQVLGAGS